MRPAPELIYSDILPSTVPHIRIFSIAGDTQFTAPSKWVGLAFERRSSLSLESDLEDDDDYDDGTSKPMQNLTMAKKRSKCG